MLDNLKLVRPVKWIRWVDWRLTQKWGERPEYYKTIWRPYHLWLDYAGPKPWDKIPVYSSSIGIARVRKDPKWFWDYVVVEWDKFTYFSWRSVYYCHLSSISVKDWDQVTLHTEIWIMGSTWNSTAVHLHFGLRSNDRSQGYQWRIDPTPYIVDRDTKPEPIDPDVQWLIDDWIFNGNYEPMDYKRLIKMMWKLYNKVK